MANKVFANGREISCKAAQGQSICAFPDVCMTPPQNPATPPGVPIPYPNTGMATDATAGSKKVKISGKEVMLKNQSHFKKSMGDEAGAAAKKGVITSKNMGKVYFTTWSMDVKIEGQNAVRAFDLTTHNHMSMPGNTPPWPYLDGMAMAQTAEVEKGTLKVKVTDRCTGDGVEDAEVTVGKVMKKTSASGEAEFPALMPGAVSAAVVRHFEDCDYVTFLVHYPAITMSKQAKSNASGMAELGPGATEELEVKIEIFRLVPEMRFVRKQIELNGEDKYGHWWTELDGRESYGWWPKYPVGSEENQASEPPTRPTPPAEGSGKLAAIQHKFATAAYTVTQMMFSLREHAFSQTLRGVEGELNGLAFGGSPTQDPHHGDDSGEEYQPVIDDCRTDEVIRGCMRSFANAYAGKSGGKWSWRFEFGNHCHTFQIKLMDHCNTKKVKPL